MRTIDKQTVKREVKKLICDSLIVPDRAVTAALKALDGDTPGAEAAAALIVRNNEIAEREGVYCCQDTGQAVFMVTLGGEVCCPDLKSALVEAAREGYAAARKSVADPLTRNNTGDNTPPIIEVELVEGDTLEISFLAKGAGSENMTRLYMLKPTDGEDGIVSAIVDAVDKGGRNACPPLVVGVGIGGVSETACTLSKKALLRPLGEHNKRADAADIEKKALEKINGLGIGIAALGGRTTALAVNVELAPTHIGMLPVAVNLQCHSLRHGTVKL